MTLHEFWKLSIVLVLEIFIAHGMVFVVEETNDIANIANQTPIVLPTLPLVSATVPEQDKEVNLPDPIVVRNSELTLQGQLANPPEVIQAVYLTSWSAGTESRINYVMQLARDTNVNAVVIDIKDFSGEISYVTSVPEVKLYGAEHIKIRNLEKLVERFHKEGIYVIARVTVFQDPVLAQARPDLAVQSIENETVWTDYKGLAWVDPNSKEVWNYVVSIARDAASKGVDEINFDYVRFPSDGNLQDMHFPAADNVSSRRQTLEKFFAHLKQHLPDVAISADLFGLSTSSHDDLGIGQVIEDAYKHFDFVYPMVYPSHYAQGYRGYAKPAEYPYEIIHFSMRSAQLRLDALKALYPEQKFAELRPWIQDFDLGAEYSPIMVQAQVQAAKDALGEKYRGFLFWAPTNWYTTEALNSFLFNWGEYQGRPLSLPD